MKSELPQYSGRSSLRTAPVAVAATVRWAGKLTAEEDAVALVRCSAGASHIVEGMLVASSRALGVVVSVIVSVDVDCCALGVRILVVLVEMLFDCCTGLSTRPVLRVLCFSSICWGSSA